MYSKNIDADSKSLANFVVRTQPVLSTLNENAVVEDLRFLQEAIKSTIPGVIEIMEARLMYPLVSIMISTVSPLTVKEAALDCICAILDSIKIKSIDTFFQLYLTIVKLIFDSKNCSWSTKVPEEFVVSALLCLTAVAENLDDNTKHHLYSDEYAKFMSQGILMCNKISSLHKNKSMRVAALKFLLALSQYGCEDSELFEKVAVVFIQFTPGIVSALTDTITKGETTHHEIIQYAIRMWGQTLVFCLSDIEDDQPSPTDEEVVQSWMSSSTASDDPNEWLKVLAQANRSRFWVQAAMQMLHPVVERVAVSRVSHPHPVIRKELANVMAKLLFNCGGSLGTKAAIPLDALVIFSRDLDDDIRDFAEGKLHLLPKVITDVAQERLPEHVTLVLRSSRSGDTSKTLMALLRLEGYLSLIYAHKVCPRLMTTPLHLKNFLSALEASATLCVGRELLQQCTHDVDVRATVSQWRKYKRLCARGSKCLGKLCQMLSVWALETVIELLGEEPSVASLVLLTLAVPDKDTSHAIDPHVTKALLNLFLRVNEMQNLSEDVKAKEMEKRVLKVALAMEGIGKSALSVEGDLSRFLLESLYPIVERIGSTYAVVRASALLAAYDIAKITKDDSLEHLFERNVDYLTHHIQNKLRRREDNNENILAAARVVTKYCPKDLVNSLGRVIKQVVCSSEEVVSSQYISGYLHVFLAFVQCVSVGASNTQTSSETDTNNPPNTTVTAILNLRDYIAKKDEERRHMDAEENASPEENEEMEMEEQKAALPPEVELCKAVVRRALHCLPVHDDRTKLVALEVVRTGIQALKPYENELLPIVHEVWSPLVARFSPKASPLVLSRSFHLLTELASLAKDFIRFRTLKEVLPALRDALHSTEKQSKDGTRPRAYHTTQLYKMQRQLLQGLGYLTRDLNLRERETNWVVEAALLYMSSHQPKPLQEEAVKLFRILLEHDPCMVAYRFQTMVKNPEYTSNVKLVLGNDV